MQNYKEGASEFYTQNLEKDIESLSGQSSTLLSTYYLRENLKKIFKDKNIKSISDCPCGDWNWMRTVKLNGIEYTGYDILPEIIILNEQIFPEYDFIIFDALEDILPKTDLIISKDFMTHLNDDLIYKALENFKKSGSRYLLATSYTTESPELPISGNWGWRQINMESYGVTPDLKFYDAPNRYHGLFKLN